MEGESICLPNYCKRGLKKTTCRRSTGRLCPDSASVSSPPPPSSVTHLWTRSSISPTSPFISSASCSSLSLGNKFPFSHSCSLLHYLFPLFLSGYLLLLLLVSHSFNHTCAYKYLMPAKQTATECIQPVI